MRWFAVYVFPFLFLAVVIVLLTLRWRSIEAECRIVCGNHGAVDMKVTREELCACVMPDSSIKMMAR